MCILLYTNYCIYKVVKKLSKVIVTGEEHYTYNKQVQFLMLFGVVILLTITNLYRFCANVHSITIHHYLECCMVHLGNEIAVTIATVLSTINTSANCFIYMAASKDFRYYVLHFCKRPFQIFRQFNRYAISSWKTYIRRLEPNLQEAKIRATSIEEKSGFEESKFCTQIETISSDLTNNNVIPVIKLFLVDDEYANK